MKKLSMLFITLLMSTFASASFLDANGRLLGFEVNALPQNLPSCTQAEWDSNVVKQACVYKLDDPKVLYVLLPEAAKTLPVPVDALVYVDRQAYRTEAAHYELYIALPRGTSMESTVAALKATYGEPLIRLEYPGTYPQHAYLFNDPKYKVQVLSAPSGAEAMLITFTDKDSL